MPETQINRKDYWRTPPELVDDALAILGVHCFDVDICCSSFKVKISKAQNFISEEDDALELLDCWFDRGYYSFCNPPFSKKWDFFKTAVKVVNHKKRNVLMVLPYTPVTKEWRENIDNSNCIVYVPDGRYQFLTEEGKLPMRLNKKTGRLEKTSPDFPVALVLIVPFFTDGAKYINYERGFKNV